MRNNLEQEADNVRQGKTCNQVPLSNVDKATWVKNCITLKNYVDGKAHDRLPTQSSKFVLNESYTHESMMTKIVDPTRTVQEKNLPTDKTKLTRQVIYDMQDWFMLLHKYTSAITGDSPIKLTSSYAINYS